MMKAELVQRMKGAMQRRLRTWEREHARLKVVAAAMSVAVATTAVAVAVAVLLLLQIQWMKMAAQQQQQQQQHQHRRPTKAATVTRPVQDLPATMLQGPSSSRGSASLAI